MKYGEHLKANIAPEYGAANYLDYSRLDEIISELARAKPSRYVPEFKCQSVTCVVAVQNYVSWSIPYFCRSFRSPELQYTIKVTAQSQTCSFCTLYSQRR